MKNCKKLTLSFASYFYEKSVSITNGKKKQQFPLLCSWLEYFKNTFHIFLDFHIVVVKILDFYFYDVKECVTPSFCKEIYTPTLSTNRKDLNMTAV